MSQNQQHIANIRHDISRLGEQDLHWLNEGTHFRLYDQLGAHCMTSSDGESGVYFAVFAPNALGVWVMGDFNEWDPSRHPLRMRANSGVWEGFVPAVQQGARYKYHVAGKQDGYRADKADPYGFRQEPAPSNASVVWPLDYEWGDAAWMEARHAQGRQEKPVAIYEVHPGSWMRGEGNRMLSYRELAPRLVEYVQKMGFTHVELLPVMEHPFYGSWGYQCTGYFAPTSRYGTPQDLMFLIDQLHQGGIGVILDWVPGHFPSDEHGPGYFDGTHLYEHPDPRRGIHPEWKSYVFDYERREVRSFLFSSAFFWADKYHADGFRVDAVTSMIYLNHGRRDGEWIPNRHGGFENLEAVDFLRRFHDELNARFPDVRTYAEEATAWPKVTGATSQGGLGFDYKWDMGWMNDTLEYFKQDPLFRKGKHDKMTFRAVYAFNEKFVLPLSHDEVVHGKASLLGRMPGDEAQKFANLRLLMANLYMQPGKKMLFMGGEFGQWSEWAHDQSLDWHLLAFAPHQGMQRWVQDLNRTYRQEPALHEYDTREEGFAWIDCEDKDNSVLSFLRMGSKREEPVLVVLNHTPVFRERYRVGVPMAGFWQEILNSDAPCYGGTGLGNLGGTWTEPKGHHDQGQSLTLTLPPLGCVVCKRVPEQSNRT